MASKISKGTRLLSMVFSFYYFSVSAVFYTPKNPNVHFNTGTVQGERKAKLFIKACLFLLAHMIYFLVLALFCLVVQFCMEDLGCLAK